MGSGGFDPYGISELDSDSSSGSEDYVQVRKQDQRQVQDQNDRRKQAAKDARRKHRIKAKRKGRVPKEAGASKRQKAGPAVQVLIDQEWVTVPEPLPMSDDEQPRRGARVTFEQEPKIVDEAVIYKNWTTPGMRRDQQAWIDLDRSVNEKEAHTPSVVNSVGRQREMARLLASPHLQHKQVDLQQLLSAETEEEINAMYTGQELERQRSAIPCGPLYVSAAFGEAKIVDIAAIDSGATQSFVSKSWLYD